MYKLYFFLLLILFSATSCTTILNSMSSSSERESELSQLADKFHNNLYFRAFDKMSEHVADNFRQSYTQKLKNQQKEEKVTDVETLSINFFEQSKKASIVINVKYFKKPVYVVTSRKYKESWEFKTTNGGWKLVNSEEIE